MNSQKTVVVGMSGGVDSSVAALLLKQQGYRVIGIFMHNWDDNGTPFSECTASHDWSDVAKICATLDIPYYLVDYRKEYKEQVFKPFLADYSKGHTPNPDILCNKYIKFDLLLKKACSLGADYLATGHYANTQAGKLLTAKDQSKDQTYFLHAICGKHLEKILFPLGNLLKADVRQIAKEHHLLTHNKKDSTGICFIGERKFDQFLANYLPRNPGDFCRLNGQVVGKHQGACFYTIGQRRHLGLGGAGERWYVVKKDMAKNIVYVERSFSHPELYQDHLTANALTWIQYSPKTPFVCQAKIRYRQEAQDCTIEKIENETVFVSFKNPQRAITPRQSIVFYYKNECLGGAVIQENV